MRKHLVVLGAAALLGVAGGSLYLAMRRTHREATTSSTSVKLERTVVASTGSGKPTRTTQEVQPSEDDRPLVRDPRAPGYDAARLYGTSWSDAMGIYGAEPRNEPWATLREREIRDAVETEFKTIDPKSEITIECHTQSCSVKVVSDNPMLSSELHQYPLVCISSFVEPDFQDGYAEHFVIFGEENASTEGFHRQQERECPKWREAFYKTREKRRKAAGSASP